MTKPSIPKGTRDFGPVEMARRNYIFNTIRSTFQVYGYQPIETPAMENLSTLLGKYGEEGDKLLFKILNSGDFLVSGGITNEEGLIAEPIRSGQITSKISEKGLRYDLTVPFARFVVQHRNEIQFPFKRFQIQPVWRADRPQKGRYREFYQCDVDVIGSHSLLYETELIQIIEEVFETLGIEVSIHLNNRKILAAIANLIGESSRLIAITVAIDKLDKIGIEGVINELRTGGLSDEAIQKLQPILELKGSNEEKLATLSELFANDETGSKGIEELTHVFQYLNRIQPGHHVQLDLTLARGLNYYTGAIIEVKAENVSIGSICGGGRYDDLTGVFGLKDVSGVGISFGADRIYDVLNELSLFPDEVLGHTFILVTNFGNEEEFFSLEILKELRRHEIPAEIYPEAAGMKKQFGYADQKKIPYVLLTGSEEIASGKLKLKNMLTGNQIILEKEKLTEYLKGLFIFGETP